MTGSVVIPFLFGFWLLGMLYWMKSVKNDEIVSRKIAEYLDHRPKQVDKPYHGGTPGLDSTRGTTNASTSWNPIRDSGFVWGSIMRVFNWLYEHL